MDISNELSLSLMGDSENLITWGAILARKGFTLTGIYMPTHCEALASVLLLGCPAYDNYQETAESGDILFVEAHYFSALTKVEKEQVLGTKTLKAVVFMQFNEKAPTADIEDGRQSIELESAYTYLNNISEVQGSSEPYYLQIEGRLPAIGKDIIRVDEVCAGQPHEPIPTEDYPLNCSEVGFVLKPLREVSDQEENIGRILETILL